MRPLPFGTLPSNISSHKPSHKAFFSDFFFSGLNCCIFFVKIMSDSTEPKEVQVEENVEQTTTEAFPVTPKLKCLVIDTNAIINGMSLRNMAEEFYTCPEVLYELRSAHSREFLSRLPFELKIINPTEEALKFGNYKNSTYARKVRTYLLI